jgi:fucose permease
VNEDMNFDVSYVWPGACIGWFLVTVVLTAHNWKKLLASIIAWVVCIDVFAILGSIVTPFLRNSAHSQAIGSAVLVLPFAAFLWLLIRLLSRLRDATPNDRNA